MRTTQVEAESETPGCQAAEPETDSVVQSERCGVERAAESIDGAVDVKMASRLRRLRRCFAAQRFFGMAAWLLAVPVVLYIACGIFLTLNPHPSASSSMANALMRFFGSITPFHHFRELAMDPVTISPGVVFSGPVRVEQFDLTSAFVMVLASIVLAIVSRSARRLSVRTLQGFTDVRALGDLLSAVRGGVRSGRREAERALVSLLPNIRTEDSTRVAARDRSTLRSLRTRHELPDLQVAILTAVKRIGNTADVAAVESLVDRAASERVRAAAAECAQELRKRETDEANRGTLLRPAATAGDAALLRPAQGVSAATDNLLQIVE